MFQGDKTIMKFTQRLVIGKSCLYYKREIVLQLEPSILFIFITDELGLVEDPSVHSCSRWRQQGKRTWQVAHWLLLHLRVRDTKVLLL